ncbi:MAG TPA: prephenate dehydrogenase/arogenate dehydrogenase family protein [Vicinamibacterales bacterium]|nr:prephenate dehydrogenase/arogenate dehydrogenase family protein [Vicinamibacterales bacterium]
MIDGPFGRVAVVGFGLVGASVARAAAKRWPRIAIVALDKGDSLSRITGADLVVLAAPVLASIEALTALPPHLSPGAVVTDVCSTKRLIAAAADAFPSLTFIGGHPMAGDVRSGAAHARADLFEGRPWILTPGPNHTAELQRLEAFVGGLGGVPHIMTPELHDRFVGAVSHLPQLTASALMHVVGKLAGDAGLEIAGRGLHDTTRLAGSSPALWRDITMTNPDVLRAALDVLIGTLTEMRDTLDTGTAVEEVFTSACRWRDTLDRGH